MVMTHLGQTDKGLAKLDEAIRHLDEPGSVDRMDAFIIAVKRKISALNDQGRYDEVIPLAQRIGATILPTATVISTSVVPRPMVSWPVPMP